MSATTDPDGATRAPHRDPRMLALVLAGGTIGTALRAALGLTAPGMGTTITLNLAGAFLLGLLVAALAGGGPDVGARRTVRLALGTGLLGGFTTYSTMATDAAGLLRQGAPNGALEVLTATVLGGVLAAAAGLAVGSRLP